MSCNEFCNVKSGKKKRAKTSLPAVKDGKNARSDAAVTRAKSIPPPNKQKQVKMIPSSKKKVMECLFLQFRRRFPVK